MTWKHFENDAEVYDFLKRISRKNINLKKSSYTKELPLKIWEVAGVFGLQIRWLDGGCTRTATNRNRSEYRKNLKDWWCTEEFGQGFYWLPRGKAQSATYRTNMIEKNIHYVYKRACEKAGLPQIFCLAPYHSTPGHVPAFSVTEAEIIGKSLYPLADSHNPSRYASIGWIGPYTIERFTAAQNNAIDSMNQEIARCQKKILEWQQEIDRQKLNLEFAETNMSHFIAEEFDES